MKKIKRIRNIIVLECVHCLKIKASRGISQYTTSKNFKNTVFRLTLQKFCYFSNKHQLFKETK